MKLAGKSEYFYFEGSILWVREKNKWTEQLIWCGKPCEFTETAFFNHIKFLLYIKNLETSINVSRKFVAKFKAIFRRFLYLRITYVMQ